ncbi:MAG: 16S rRNA (guanine(966)-N(2))-methyltransferase RsmD [Candidatus Omnitrophica bacterium]|nr:16S rRNA (guanine(966)-N(2))-methyltransferase RsmD [Candidatus Omnitrophota bacterium]
MRIIAGKYRSRLIKVPKNAEVRPTKDRIREALFNIIIGYVNNAAVLDIFAGSGAFGIESISRGAESAAFIDSEKACIETIEENLKTLGIEGSKVSLIRMDAFKAIDKLCNDGKKFDIILLDPPYYEDMAKKCLIKLGEHDILKPRCIIVVEHHKKDILPTETGNITSYRTVCYGDIRLTFYRLKENQS